jgi:hypothetical protein
MEVLVCSCLESVLSEEEPFASRDGWIGNMKEPKRPNIQPQILRRLTATSSNSFWFKTFSKETSLLVKHHCLMVMSELVELLSFYSIGDMLRLFYNLSPAGFNNDPTVWLDGTSQCPKYISINNANNGSRLITARTIPTNLPNLAFFVVHKRTNFTP